MKNQRKNLKLKTAQKRQRFKSQHADSLDWLIKSDGKLDREKVNKFGSFIANECSKQIKLTKQNRFYIELFIVTSVRYLYYECHRDDFTMTSIKKIINVHDFEDAANSVFLLMCENALDELQTVSGFEDSYRKSLITLIKSTNEEFTFKYLGHVLSETVAQMENDMVKLHKNTLIDH